MDTTASLLASLEDQVTCHNCLEVFEDPRELPCRHSLCLGCYTKMHADNKGLVTCPLCRAEWHSQPGDLLVNETVMKVVETYKNFKKQSTSSTVVSKKQSKCQIPGCKKDSVNMGPFWNLELCQGHYRKDLENLKMQCNKLLGNKGLKDKMEWLKKQVERLQEEMDNIGTVFRELEKTLRLKKEQLEAELETNIRMFREELEIIEEQCHQLEDIENQIKDTLKNEDFLRSGECLKQLQLIHDSSYLDVKDMESITIQEKLTELQNFVTSALGNCLIDVIQKEDNIIEREEIQDGPSSEISEKLYNALLEASYTFEERKCIDFCTKNTIQSVQYMSKTTGYYHDISMSCSYENVHGCIVKSTESKLRPLPDVVVIVQACTCKKLFLVYTTVGSLMSLIRVPECLQDDRLLVCDSITQSIFLYSHRNSFGSGIYQLTLAGEFLCRLSIDNVRNAAVPRSGLLRSQQLNENDKNSILIVLVVNTQPQQTCEIFQCKVTSDNTQVVKAISLSGESYHNCINLVDDKIFILSWKNSNYFITIFKQDSLMVIQKSKIQVAENDTISITGMKHIIKDIFTLILPGGKMALLRIDKDSPTCNLQNEYLLNEYWDYKSHYVGISVCVYSDTLYPQSIFFWMFQDCERPMKLYEICIK